MQLGKIVGSATATVKHASLRGCKLLLVQPYLTNGKPDGFPQLAADTVGAGIGETVMITSDGRYAREYLKTDVTPLRWTIIGIKDPQ
jgi:ethanolamine utilization protein EutN